MRKILVTIKQLLSHIHLRRLFDWHTFPKDKPIDSIYEISIYLGLILFCYWLYSSFNRIDYREININVECLDDSFRMIPLKDKKVIKKTPSVDLRYCIPMTIVEKFVDNVKNKPNLSAVFGYTHIENINDSALISLYMYTDSIRRKACPQGINSLISSIQKRTYIDSLNLSSFLDQRNIDQICNKDKATFLNNRLDSLYSKNKNYRIKGGTFYYNLEHEIIEGLNFNFLGSLPKDEEMKKTEVSSDSCGFGYYRNIRSDKGYVSEGFITGLSTNFSHGTEITDNAGNTIGTPNGFTLYDISQAYYNIKIVSSSIDAITLTMDFVGMTEFSDMNPEPDTITLSCIKFSDPLKILKIRKDGLEFYAKFKELENFQNVRLFLLSAIMSALITILLVFIVISSYKVIIKCKKQRSE